MSSDAAGADAARAGYRVRVVRSGGWWAITVPALRGVFSQAERLDCVESNAREAIAMMLDVDESEVGPIRVDVRPSASTADDARRDARIGVDRFGSIHSDGEGPPRGGALSQRRLTARRSAP